MTGEEMGWVGRQRLIDPQLCSACFGCFEACPEGAVVTSGSRVAIDVALCNDCGVCAADCSSDAIRLVLLDSDEQPHSVDEQLSWDCLPDSGP